MITINQFNQEKKKLIINSGLFVHPKSKSKHAKNYQNKKKMKK